MSGGDHVPGFDASLVGLAIYWYYWLPLLILALVWKFLPGAFYYVLGGMLVLIVGAIGYTIYFNANKNHPVVTLADPAVAQSFVVSTSVEETRKRIFDFFHVTAVDYWSEAETKRTRLDASPWGTYFAYDMHNLGENITRNNFWEGLAERLNHPRATGFATAVAMPVPLAEDEAPPPLGMEAQKLKDAWALGDNDIPFIQSFLAGGTTASAECVFIQQATGYCWRKGESYKAGNDSAPYSSDFVIRLSASGSGTEIRIEPINTRAIAGQKLEWFEEPYRQAVDPHTEAVIVPVAATEEVIAPLRQQLELLLR